MDVPRCRLTDSFDELEAAIREAGCVVVEDVVAPEAMDAIDAELAPYIEATAPGGDDFAGLHTRRTGALLARSTGFRDLAAHPVVVGALDRVLGHATSYQLHLTQVIEIGPGEPAQYIHRDQWAFDFFPFPPGYEVECHTMWAMSEFTDENGATRVIPGSHRYEDRIRTFTEADTVPAEMSKGSVLLYIGSLYHGGGANRSSAPRRGINVGYTLSWLRQEENQYLACPPEVARELPESLARLAGYQRGAYALGYYGDLRDPIEAVHGERDAAPTFSSEGA
jgi:ectoine hydroxylase-related dioxygenase (phytanoyl-CoA dioxygenase family)